MKVMPEEALLLAGQVAVVTGRGLGRRSPSAWGRWAAPSGVDGMREHGPAAYGEA